MLSENEAGEAPRVSCVRGHILLAMMYRDPIELETEMKLMSRLALYVYIYCLIGVMELLLDFKLVIMNRSLF